MECINRKLERKFLKMNKEFKALLYNANDLDNSDNFPTKHKVEKYNRHSTHYLRKEKMRNCDKTV